jgi:hypothetical protein
MSIDMKAVTILTAAAMIAATYGAKADSLPLERGYYVNSDTPCGRASNATTTLFNGISFGSSHVECRKLEARKQAGGSYQIKEQCRDMQGSGGKWTNFITEIIVLSRTELMMTTPYAKASYRYCRQSELPEPWSNIDLSK